MHFAGGAEFLFPALKCRAEVLQFDLQGGDLFFQGRMARWGAEPGAGVGLLADQLGESRLEVGDVPGGGGWSRGG